MAYETKEYLRETRDLWQRHAAEYEKRLAAAEWLLNAFAPDVMEEYASQNFISSTDWTRLMRDIEIVKDNRKAEFLRGYLPS